MLACERQVRGKRHTKEEELEETGRNNAEISLIP